ncbi:MAG TPA: hypothetical protein VH482_35015 [Thermomicrobiales bacterium]|jgi:hypothetical protein
MFAVASENTGVAREDLDRQLAAEQKAPPAAFACQDEAISGVALVTI